MWVQAPPFPPLSIVESFNGRNADSDSENVGSIPASTAIRLSCHRRSKMRLSLRSGRGWEERRDRQTHAGAAIIQESED